MILLIFDMRGYMLNSPCNWILAIIPTMFMAYNSLEDYILDIIFDKIYEKKDDEE